MSNITHLTTFNLEEWTSRLDEVMVERWYWVSVAHFVFMCFVYVTGVAENLLTCVVIYSDRSMHTVTNYYLFNLAVSDLIVSVGLLLALKLAQYPYEFYNDTLCQIHYFLIVTLWNNSILTMTAIAIERYIAIWHPMLLSKRSAWRRVMKIICVIWTVAILETLPEIWTVFLIKTKNTMVCFVVPTMFARILNGVLALVTFVMPLGIMTFVYTMVALKVNVTQKSYLKINIFNHRNSSSKVNKLVALTLSFLVCWLPFFSLRILLITQDMHHARWCLQYWDMLLMLATSNSWFSIVLNPMLFNLMSTKFRIALKGLWATKMRAQESIANTRTVAQ